MKRLRIVQVLVTVVTAVDDGTDLHVNPNPQQQTIPTLGALQEFAAVHLPAAIAAEEERLNAPALAAAEPIRTPNRAERRQASKRAARSGAIHPEDQAPTLEPAAVNGVAAG